MINQRLVDLATATCFSSEQMAALLKRHLMSNERKLSSFFLDRDLRAQTVRQTLVDALDKDHPRRFRLNDMAQAFATFWPASMFSDDKFPLLSHCFNQLFCYYANSICYQESKIQDYAALMLKLDPSLVVSWHLACEPRYQSQLLLSRQIAEAKPLFCRVSDAKVYAENHTHLGGMHFDGLVLSAAFLDVERHHDYGDGLARQLKPLFRLLHLLLNEGQMLANMAWDQKEYDQLHREFIDKVQHNLGLSWVLNIEVKTRLDFMSPISSEQKVSLPWLKTKFIQTFNDGEQSQAWLWLLTWLWTFYRQINCHYIRTTVVYFINALMVIRRKLIMDGRGLTRFTRFYFNQALRKNASSYQYRIKESVAKLLAGPNDVAEIKSTLGLYQPQLIEQLLTAMAQQSGIEIPDVERHQRSEQQLTQYSKLMNRWQLCLHITRKLDYQHKPEKVWQEVKLIKQRVEQVGNWHTPLLFAQDFQLNSYQPTEQTKRLVPSRWIRGLDVAGDENQLHFEVFAAPLRWLKVQLEQQNKEKIHYSIHCGEDYAHPLSGLRKVDETIQFCQLSQGDRLGHGLALGIIPKHWFEHHGDIILDTEEHFDNLVWAYGYAKKLVKKLKIGSTKPLNAIALLERKVISLNFKIRYLASTVSWAKPKDTPEDLFAAWQLRRNCFYQWQQQESYVINPQELAIVLPDRQKLNNVKLRAREIYLRRWQYQRGIRVLDKPLKNAKSKVLIRLDHQANDKIARLKGELNIYRDDHNESDLHFMYLLQEYMLEQCRQKALIIEVNLTSNVSIAHIENYSEHPIFRWHPVKGDYKFKQKHNLICQGPIDVCINTDDAGIMPTTLRSEYQLLRQAALQRGEKPADVEKWLEKLRQFSHQVFKNTHKDVFSTTLLPDLLGF